MQGESNVDIDTQGEQLLEELLDLRREVAQALGRDQYVYRMIDNAVESQHTPTMAEALRAMKHCEDLQGHVSGSVRATKKTARA